MAEDGDRANSKSKISFQWKTATGAVPSPETSNLFKGSATASVANNLLPHKVDQPASRERAAQDLSSDKKKPRNFLQGVFTQEQEDESEVDQPISAVGDKNPLQEIGGQKKDVLQVRPSLNVSVTDSRRVSPNKDCTRDESTSEQGIVSKDVASSTTVSGKLSKRGTDDPGAMVGLSSQTGPLGSASSSLAAAGDHAAKAALFSGSLKDIIAASKGSHDESDERTAKATVCME